MQGQVTLKLECLIKRMPDADIPNTNTSLSAKSSIGDNIEKQFKKVQAQTKTVVELVE